MPSVVASSFGLSFLIAPHKAKRPNIHQGDNPKMTALLSGDPSDRHSPACAHPRPAPHGDPNPQGEGYRLADPSDRPGFHTLRLLAIGSLYAVNNCRDSLHALGYAHPSEWSHPMPLAGNSGLIRGLTPTDVMRILTKRITLPPR